MHKKLFGGLALVLFMACSETKEAKIPPPVTSLPHTPISLADLSAFQTPGANWTVAGAVSAPIEEKVAVMDHESGMGVLLNSPSKEAEEDLFFGFEHGDLELELDFMMPKGSNSGVYLQGRYEVQLLDSWGKKEVGYGDCGGIYQRWDESQPEGQKGYEGYPPRLNASRAPGLWQHLKIRFLAPRFDEQGNKTENAMMEGVWLNGAKIHEKVSLSGPTRGAFFEEEAALGPVVIQGDHGPVAFRNIRYKTYGQNKIELAEMAYDYFKVETSTQKVDSLTGFDLASLSPDQSSSSDTLSAKLSPERSDFLLQFKGKMIVPDSGQYVFKTKVGGGMKLTVNGETVLWVDGERNYADEPVFGDLRLAAGENSFVLTYLQNHRWWRGGLGVWVEGPDMDFQPLHAEGSVPPPQPYNPLWVEAGERTRTHRSFVMHRGTKLTHAISVGSPQGVNYNYELMEGRLLHLWKGPFLDAAPMWEGRGQTQLSVPGGPALVLSGQPTFAPAATNPGRWPQSVAGKLVFKGYDLDEDGLAIFRYQLGELELADQLRPLAGGRGWQREIKASGTGAVQVLLSAGESIQAREDGLYLLDGGAYYLSLAGAMTPQLSRTETGQNLTTELKGGESLRYEWIW
jgi:hypothetical protein